MLGIPAEIKVVSGRGRYSEQGVNTMSLLCLRTICPALLAVILSMSWSSPVRAQALRLVQHETKSAAIEALVGDTLHLDVVADLGSLSVAGLSLYVRMPDDGFEIIGSGPPSRAGVRPFLAGELMQGAREMRNTVLRNEPGAPQNDCLLSFAAVLGPGSHRALRGAGTIARISLRCQRPMASVRISLHSNPVNESRIVLTDGRSEIPLPPSPGVGVDVVAPTSITALMTWGQLKATIAPDLR